MKANAWLKLAAVSITGIVLSIVILWGIGSFQRHNYYNGYQNGYGYNGMNMNNGNIPMNQYRNNMNRQGGMNMQGSGSMNMQGGGGMNNNQGSMNMQGGMGMNMQGGGQQQGSGMGMDMMNMMNDMMKGMM